MALTDALAIPDSSTLDRQGAELVNRARALVVIDDVSYVAAGEELKTVKLYLKAVAEFCDPVVTAAHQVHKAAVAQRTTLSAHAEEAERIYKRGREGYEDDQRRLREEAERVARLERERLEAAERERVAAEQRRLQAEAEERRLAEAVAAEQAGDRAAAEKLLEAPVVAPPVAPRPVFVPPPAVRLPEPPKTAGISSRQDWDFEITNADALPRSYLIPDEVAIRKVVRAMGARAQIPGVRVFQKTVTSVKA